MYFFVYTPRSLVSAISPIHAAYNDRGTPPHTLLQIAQRRASATRDATAISLIETPLTLRPVACVPLAQLPYSRHLGNKWGASYDLHLASRAPRHLITQIFEMQWLVLDAGLGGKDSLGDGRVSEANATISVVNVQQVGLSKVTLKCGSDEPEMDFYESALSGTAFIMTNVSRRALPCANWMHSKSSSLTELEFPYHISHLNVALLVVEQHNVGTI
ncbi:hypothetical protein CC86DRAFT_380954 [Ophiobolus disseminans]|uniref:Uncharacterized protein n=1 Tax=Ophiobolus disseminans TaxID=1469910 RepID=A0A6A7A3S7_9PLEO|nr:hypothetical protein CC86DRAFT_380954 [Ophiobolus disseminans]